MHELGIADAMVKTIDRILAEQAPGAPVTCVTVELGQLSGVVERFLYDAWRAVTDGTAYAETVLKIHPVPAARAAARSLWSPPRIFAAPTAAQTSSRPSPARISPWPRSR